MRSGGGVQRPHPWMVSPVDPQGDGLGLERPATSAPFEQHQAGFQVEACHHRVIELSQAGPLREHRHVSQRATGVSPPPGAPAKPATRPSGVKIVRKAW